MDWMWFWGALGESAKNAGPMVVGVVGILATLKAGTRTLEHQARRDAETLKRTMYADYISAAGEIVDHLVVVGAVFGGFPQEGTNLAAARRTRPDLFPDLLGAETGARLSRGAAMIELLHADDAVGDAVWDLHGTLMGALVMADKGSVTADVLNKMVDSTGKQYVRTVRLLRTHLEDGSARVRAKEKSAISTGD